MKPKTDNSAKQRSRVRMQQNIVSFCCFLCVVFAVGWIIHSAGNKTDLFSPDTSSSQVRSDSSVKPADSSLPGESSSQGDVTTPDVPSDAHPYTVAKDVNDELDDALFI